MAQVLETRFFEAMEDTTYVIGEKSGRAFFAWSTSIHDAEKLAACVTEEEETDGKHGWEFHDTIDAAHEAMSEAWECLTMHGDTDSEVHDDSGVDWYADRGLHSGIGTHL